MKDYDAIIQKHKAFWNFSNRRPLIIDSIGWVDGPRLLAKADDLNSGNLMASDFWAERFWEAHRDLCLQAESICDDKITMTEPLAAIPWLEAYNGCSITIENKTMEGAYIWPRRVCRDIEETEELISNGPKSEWLHCYIAYMRDLNTAVSDKWAVSQPILRGISDVACALMGTQEFILGLMDDQERSRAFLRFIAENNENFYLQHMQNVPGFRGGYTVGQYFLWTPKMCMRLQDDAIAVLSPDLYETFILEYTERLSALTDYTLMHLHLTSRHMLDRLCAVQTIRAIEYDVDEGSESVLEHIETFKKIQHAGKNLIIKARFKKDDIPALKSLEPGGLCLIPVVDKTEETKEINAMLG